MNGIHIPEPPLSRYVACLWSQTGPVTGHGLERSLPDGAVELVISLTGEPLRVPQLENPRQRHTLAACLAYGPHTRPFLIDTAAPRSILAVHFKPGGAFPFFPLPMGELHNQIVPLDALWHAEAGHLLECLQAAPDMKQRFQILEGFLRARLIQSSAQHPAVGFALHALRSSNQFSCIADVVDAVGLSSRRFSLVFGQQVGMTPKAYQRLNRFQRVLRSLAESTHVDWADLALVSGYFDQSHLTQEFRLFAGMTPAAYNRQPGKRPGHVPLITG